MSEKEKDKGEFQEIKLLTKEDILKANDSQKKLVDVSKWWGGSVYVKSLTATERDKFDESIQKMDDDGKSIPVLENMRAKLCALTICDANGVRLFGNDDIVNLGKKNAGAVEKCFDVARELNGMRKEDLEKMAKNSEKGQS